MSASRSGDEERTALVTVASSGIGRRLTEMFAADGHEVVPVSRSQG